MSIRHRWTVVALLVTAYTPANASAALIQALDFTGGSLAQSNANSTLGWEFRLSTTVTVTELGFFDEGGAGLADSHQLGLWTSGGTLLASTTIGSGLSGTAVVSGSGFGSFRYTPITAVVLTPGDYVLGASYGSDDFLYLLTSSVATAAGIEYLLGRQENGSGFTFPSVIVIGDRGAQSFFGPNLRFSIDDVAVPEPGTLALAGAALVPLVMIVQRRKRSAGSRRF